MFGLFLILTTNSKLLLYEKVFSLFDCFPFDGNFSTSSKTTHSFNIPLNLKYSFEVRGTGVHFTTGPNFAFNVGNRSWNFNNLLSSKKLGNTSYEVNGVFKNKVINTTWNIGAGINVFSALDLGIVYNFAIGKVGTSALNQTGVNAGNLVLPSYKTNTFSLQASYYF